MIYSKVESNQSNLSFFTKRCLYVVVKVFIK